MKSIPIFAVVFVCCFLLFSSAASAATQSELFLGSMDADRVIKSGTPLLIKTLLGEENAAFKTAYNEAAREEMDTYADSPEGHFRVHYNTNGPDAPDLTDEDGNSVPDYVDSTLVYLEYARDLIVVDLGYGQPISDGTKGGSRGLTDCYIKELSSQRLYGYSSPDVYSGAGSVSAYLVIDNDYTEGVYPTKGFDALKISTAHEYFHVLHYTYYGGYDVVWWMEHTATWMEDRAWDEVNDYLNYLGFLYDNRDIPLDSQNGSFEYGATLFAFHIAEFYGEQYLQSIWSAFRENFNGGIENINTVLPNGLATTIADLSVWLYFTGTRANSLDFFSEADQITDMILPEHALAATGQPDTLTFNHYTFKYIDITPKEGLGFADSLYFTFADYNGGSWKKRLIMYNDPADFTVTDLSGTTAAIRVPRRFNQAVLAISNTSPNNIGLNYRYAISLDITASQGVDTPPIPEPYVLDAPYPNPFNPRTTLSFTLPEESQCRLQVVNMQGQTVAILVDEYLTAGHHTFPFDGSGLSSGLYFAILDAGTKRLTQKMTLLR